VLPFELSTSDVGFCVIREWLVAVQSEASDFPARRVFRCMKPYLNTVITQKGNMGCGAEFEWRDRCAVLSSGTGKL
jgi:hypothetical protein